MKRDRYQRFLLGGLTATVLVWGCSGHFTSIQDTPRHLNPLVTSTTEGLVKGVLRDDVFEYLGLPYAAPPVGPSRWTPPRPPERYTEGTYDASYARSDCMQGSSKDSHGSEDCLYLNVFRPRGAAASKAPVLVWIHGGGYSGGSGIAYNVVPLAKAERALVVSINYRLGVLGFLTHPALSAEETPARSGNYGIMDMQAALRWIQRNIGAFGGDPKNVTVVGQSAGGNAIYVLLASPLSKGLFQKAVPQSGGFFRNQPTVDFASRIEDLHAQEANGLAIATSYGCTAEHSDPMALASVAACLRAKPAQALLEQSYIEPVIDGKVLMESTATAFAAGRFNHVPVLAGFTEDEGTIFVLSLGNTLDASNYATRLDFAGMGAAVNQEYPLQGYSSPLQGLAKAVGDYMFACSAMKDMDAISRHVPQSYVYQFADRTPASTEAFAKNYPPSIPGKLDSLAAHGTDVTYWLGLIQPNDASAARLNLSQTMMDYLGHFARTGNPNASGLPHWTPYVDGERQVMVLGYPIKISTGVFAEDRCSFWYSAPPVEGVWFR